MATPVTPQTLYADRLESAIGTLLLIHDREGHVRALDFHDFEPRMRRLLRFHYGAEGDDLYLVAKSYGPNADRLITAKRHYDPGNVFCSAIPLPVGR